MDECELRVLHVEICNTGSTLDISAFRCRQELAETIAGSLNTTSDRIHVTGHGWCPTSQHTAREICLLILPAKDAASESAAALAAVLDSAVSDPASLLRTRLAAAGLAYAADPNVLNVTNVLLNSGTADLIPSASALIRPGSILVA